MKEQLHMRNPSQRAIENPIRSRRSASSGCLRPLRWRAGKRTRPSFCAGPTGRLP